MSHPGDEGHSEWSMEYTDAVLELVKAARAAQDFMPMGQPETRRLKDALRRYEEVRGKLDAGQ